MKDMVKHANVAFVEYKYSRSFVDLLYYNEILFFLMVCPKSFIF